MEACFRLATKNTPALTSRGNDGGVVRTRRPVRAVSAPVAAVVAGWAETVWTAFEAGQSARSLNPRASSGTNDVLNANTKKSIAWRALAVALRASRAAPRSRVLDLHPELVDAALDELSVSTTKARADSGDGGDERATAPVSVVADAARVIAELVSADAGSYWADARSAPMTTACAVLESAARSAPERNAHEACVAAVAAALFSASSAANDAENLPEASRRALAEGSRRATEFLCATVPGAPHLFDERVAWRARRAALDVVRAGYQAGRPPCEPSVRDAWLRTLGEAGKPPPATHAHRDSADDRATARVSAAAATASALRADAAALAALEHARARAAGEFVASFFFPDVDEFSFQGIHAARAFARQELVARARRVSARDVRVGRRRGGVRAEIYVARRASARVLLGGVRRARGGDGGRRVALRGGDARETAHRSVFRFQRDIRGVFLRRHR